MTVVEEILALAAETRQVIVATADERGRPHIASAGKLTAGAEGHLLLAEWFCPGTIANLNRNP